MYSWYVDIMVILYWANQRSCGTDLATDINVVTHHSQPHRFHQYILELHYNDQKIRYTVHFCTGKLHCCKSLKSLCQSWENKGSLMLCPLASYSSNIATNSCNWWWPILGVNLLHPVSSLPSVHSRVPLQIPEDWMHCPLSHWASLIGSGQVTVMIIITYVLCKYNLVQNIL